MVMWWIMERTAGAGLEYHDIPKVLLPSAPRTMMESAIDTTMRMSIHRWRRREFLLSVDDWMVMMIVWKRPGACSRMTRGNVGRLGLGSRSRWCEEGGGL